MGRTRATAFTEVSAGQMRQGRVNGLGFGKFEQYQWALGQKGDASCLVLGHG